MNLDEIEAGIFTPLYGILERLLEFFDLGRGHLLGDGVRRGKGNSGRCLNYEI